MTGAIDAIDAETDSNEAEIDEIGEGTAVTEMSRQAGKALKQAALLYGKCW
jgi:hypothetical protein